MGHTKIQKYSMMKQESIMLLTKPNRQRHENHSQIHLHYHDGFHEIDIGDFVTTNF